MGTGNLSFPRDVVASTMFGAVVDFSNGNPNTSLRDIRFVLYDKDQQTVNVSDCSPKISKFNAKVE